MISIIIPIYKAETYLRRCIDSVISQTYTDWELLLIDDGSPDQCPHICDEYATKDTRINVYHKPNGGVSSARNLGLNNAKGAWITFVDADDILEENFLATIEAINNETQLVVCNCKEFLEEEKPEAKEVIPGGNYEGESLKYFCEQYLIYNVIRSPWGKFFRRELVANQHFPEDQKIGEDTVFVLQYLQKINHIQIVEGANYLFRCSSVSTNRKYALPLDFSARFMRRIFMEYLKLNVYSPVFESVEYNMFYSLVSVEERNPAIWYANPDVWKVWQVVNHFSGKRERIMAWCYHCQFTRFILRFIRN